MRNSYVSAESKVNGHSTCFRNIAYLTFLGVIRDPLPLFLGTFKKFPHDNVVVIVTLRKCRDVRSACIRRMYYVGRTVSVVGDFSYNRP